MNILRAATLILLATLTALAVEPANAGELRAVFNGKSFHLGASEDWNEDNYGLGVEYQFASRSRWKPLLMANGFRDSDEHMSYMAGGGLHRNLYQADGLHGFYVDAGINAFLMTRKDVNDNRPFPGALPSLTVGNRYMGINLTYLPRKAVEKLYSSKMLDKTTSGIVFVQFKLTLSPRSSAN